MKLIRYLILIISLFLLNAPMAFAQLRNPLGEGTTIPVLIGRVIKAVIGLSGVIALLVFVYGGFLWLISAGDANKVKKGKDAFTYALLGLVIIFTAYTAVNFVIKALQGNA